MSEPRNSPVFAPAGAETVAVGVQPARDEALAEALAQQPAAAGSPVAASAWLPALPVGRTTVAASSPQSAPAPAERRAPADMHVQPISAPLGAVGTELDVVGLTAPTVTGSTRRGSPAPTHVSGPGFISAPIQIVAAAVGLTLVAASAAMGALKHAPPVQHPTKVATFSVDNQDVPFFWPTPETARH